MTGLSALQVACMEGSINSTKQLARAPGVDIMQVDSNGRGCLEIAIEHGHLDVVVALLSLPFNMRPDIQRAVGPHQSTCLHVACAYRRYDIINFLVNERQANTTAKDSNGRTPDKVIKDPMVTLLVTGRLGETSTPFSGSSVPTPVGVSAEKKGSVTSSMVGPAPWADVALRPVTSTSSVAASTPAPLASPEGGTASRFKNRPYVPPSNPTFLPPKPAGDVSVPSPPVKSGAFLPTEKPVVNKLNIDKDNWIKQVDDDANEPNTQAPVVSTAFGNAVSSRMEGEGASAYRPPEGTGPSSGAPVVQVATATSSPAIVVKSKKKTNDDTAQLFEWVADDSKIPQLEEALGVTPNIKRDVQKIRDSESGSSLLHVACKSGHLAVAQLLVEGVGSDVNALDKKDRTSLHYAVLACRVLIVRYLVKYCGADLEIKDEDGKTALNMCNELDPGDSNAEEISRIISKASGKSPEKRMKIVLPKYTGK